MVFVEPLMVSLGRSDWKASTVKVTKTKDLERAGGSKKGMSLIEVIVAATILVTFMLPVYGLYMMNSRTSDYVRAWNNGVNLAHNIMGRLVSEDVPFLAIDPEGFGGTQTNTGRRQFEFRANFGSIDFTNHNLKSIFGASQGGDYRIDADGDRIISKGGVDFKILAYAGMYEDDTSSPSGVDPTRQDSYKLNANPTSELTFSYYPNPWFDPNNDCAENDSANQSLSAALGSATVDSTCARTVKRPINPYRQASGSVPGTFYYNRIDDPMDDRYRYGFPIPGGGSYSGEGGGAGNTKDVEEGAPDAAGSSIPQDISYSVRYEDKAFHNFEDMNGDLQDDGAFMKIVLGIAWKPRGLGGAGTAQALQEYWLVSFKANLQTSID